jgi:hypothetical protein
MTGLCFQQLPNPFFQNSFLLYLYKPPPGVGVQSEHPRKDARPACPELRGERASRAEGPVADPHSQLLTRSGPLNSYTLALLNFISPSQSTLPEPHESVSKQRTLTRLESTLTRTNVAHSKQRTLSSFRMNTYVIFHRNPFRMNTCRKEWGEGRGGNQLVTKFSREPFAGLAHGPESQTAGHHPCPSPFLPATPSLIQHPTDIKSGAARILLI